MVIVMDPDYPTGAAWSAQRSTGSAMPPTTWLNPPST
jgi:hypothetical protein